MICCSLKGKMCRHSLFTLTGCYKDSKSIMFCSHCQQTILPLDISMRQIVHNDVNMNKPAPPWCSHCEPCYLRIPQSCTFPSATRKRHSSPTNLCCQSIYPKKIIHAKQGHQNYNTFNSISSGDLLQPFTNQFIANARLNNCQAPNRKKKHH